MSDIDDLVRKIHEAKVSRQIAHGARQMAYEDGMLDIVAEYDKVIARWDKILRSIEQTPANESANE